jgi:hypothetical protein
MQPESVLGLGGDTWIVVVRQRPLGSIMQPSSFQRFSRKLQAWRRSPKGLELAAGAATGFQVGEADAKGAARAVQSRSRRVFWRRERVAMWAPGGALRNGLHGQVGGSR